VPLHLGPGMPPQAHWIRSAATRNETHEAEHETHEAEHETSATA
jgi:hypothetical protein